MADKLTEAYDKWLENATDPDLFQAFQGGFTGGAVSMRERAVKAAQASTDQNDTINSIGALPDIPE